MSEDRVMCPRCYGGGSVVKIVRREGYARREFWPCAVCEGEGILIKSVDASLSPRREDEEHR